MTTLQPTPSLHSFTSDDTLGLYYIESASTPKLNRSISDLAKNIIAEYKDEKNPLDQLDDWTLIEIVRDFIDDNQIEVENYSKISYAQNIKPNTKLRLKACIKALLKMDQQGIQLSTPNAQIPLNNNDEFVWTEQYSERAPDLTQILRMSSFANSMPQPQSLNQDSSDLTPEKHRKNKSPKMKLYSPSSLKSEQYEKIGAFWNKTMSSLMKTKTQQDLRNEFENSDCRTSVLDAKNIKICPCIERLCVVLEIYHQFDFLAYKPIRPMRLAEKLRLKEYSEKDLSDDFSHIRNHHFLNDNNSQLFICNEIHKLYGCNAGKNCCTAKRHLARKEDKWNTLPSLTRVQSNHSDYNEEDLVYSQTCDEIHYYFLHSLVKHGTRPVENTNDTVQQTSNKNSQINVNNTDNTNKPNDKEQNEEKKGYDNEENNNNNKPPNEDDCEYEETYIGAQEDKEWMDNIKDISIQDEQKLYDTLVKHMGVFKWQKPFGFKDHRGLTHIRAKHPNIKQEVLHNPFHPMPPDNWNQTLRKATQFHASWSGQKIRTRYDGVFEDAVMKHHAEWKKDTKISLQEVVTLKLYTDYDKLQFELKKCFRYESMTDIVEKCSRGHSEMVSSERVNLHLKENEEDEKKLQNQNKEDEKIVNELESRLAEFFHWRGSLLVFLNKFGKVLDSTLDNKQFILYHGVNAKMMVAPDPTTSFFGPLSTSSSYHVASTFGTDKGIVLAISSQYPRLKLCRAFDASVISDYPEEQEWLIGFIYLRVRKIYTKITKHIPFDSAIRFAFFALNLFQQQLFSVNHVLEYYLESFLQFQLFVKKNVSKDKYDNITEREGFKNLKRIYSWANPKGKNAKKFDADNIPESTKFKNLPMNKNEKIRKHRVVYMLTKKFEQLCLMPNVQQIVKVDCISPGLREYFLTHAGAYIKLRKQKKEKKYVLSFEKILDLFPNVKIIHFLNWYAFDDDAVNKLLQIDQNRPKNQVNRIKFLYFDFGNEIEKHPFFYNPDKLKKTLKNELEKKWKMVARNDSAGYTIRLKKIQ